MSIILIHTRSAPTPSSAPHQMPKLEPAGLADLSQAPAITETLDILDVLEAEAILVIREITAECRRFALLFSGGRDLVVMLHLARKTFWPAPIPLPVLHVDTSYNFPELLAYHDRMVEEFGLRLMAVRVQDYIDDGRLRERTDGTHNPLQTIPLLDAIEEGGFDGVFGGGHRDEKKARAKECIISLRDEFGQWDPRNQRPELWNLLNPYHRPDEHMWVFPLNNWAGLDVWRYIECEDIVLPGLHYVHERGVFLRDEMWLAAGGVDRLRDGEQVVIRIVRYRTVGDISCIDAVGSIAATNHDTVLEAAASTLTERRAARADDCLSEAAMEDRKKEGYFW